MFGDNRRIRDARRNNPFVPRVLRAGELGKGNDKGAGRPRGVRAPLGPPAPPCSVRLSHYKAQGLVGKGKGQGKNKGMGKGKDKGKGQGNDKGEGKDKGDEDVASSRVQKFLPWPPLKEGEGDGQGAAQQPR